MSATRRTHRRRRAAAATVIALSTVVAGGAGPAAAATPVRDIRDFACPADRVTSTFRDTAGNVHAFAIDCLATYGITRGTSATSYSPDRAVTRGQMATFLFEVLTAGGVEMQTTSQGFTDVAGNVHERAINGITSVRVARGTSATTFSPNAPVSRAQFATLLVHTLAATGIGVQIGPDAFDDDTGNVHETMINALAFNGIAAGVGPRRFDPNGQVRRDAMASFVMRGVDFGIEYGGVRSAFEDHHRLAAMTPGQVSNGTGGEPDASGTGGVWTIGQPDVVCFTMYAREVGSGQDGVESGAYLARGARGTEGEILVDLPPPTPANNAPFSAAQTSSAGCVKVHPDTVSEVVQRPEGLYLGLATFEYAEALRGQLGAIDRELTANLTGAEVVPGPGDPDGVGRAVITTTTQPDHLCWALDVTRIGTVTAARIHTGAAGANGPAVVTLAPNPGADGVVAWCTAGVDPAVVTAMETAPRNHYVQLTTTERPNGALRGQLR